LPYTLSDSAGNSGGADDDENLKQKPTKWARAILPKAGRGGGKETSPGRSGVRDLGRKGGAAGGHGRRQAVACLQDEEDGQTSETNHDEVQLRFTFHDSFSAVMAEGSAIGFSYVVINILNMTRIIFVGPATGEEQPEIFRLRSKFSIFP
jgi:hypothetical protein